ncbi:MAG: hypothetical protein BWY08_01328 [Bacteroidetes bacterium ADurb.Bin174]|nr:MAG: hypothetical protein BWY08_01328 [Bacteroidetes bacterium ADurb.Bin174]
MIGHTQGVKSAKNPPTKPARKITNNAMDPFEPAISSPKARSSSITGVHKSATLFSFDIC